MSCGVGHRCGSDLALLWLWLWHGPAATALIQPLAWEPPYATGAALKKKNLEPNQIYFSAVLLFIEILCLGHSKSIYYN